MTEQLLPEPGELWAYRKRDDAPSEQVLVLRVTQDKRKVRIEFEFVDGVNAGQTQSVSGSRLPTL